MNKESMTASAYKNYLDFCLRLEEGRMSPELEGGFHSGALGFLNFEGLCHNNVIKWPHCIVHENYGKAKFPESLHHRKVAVIEVAR